MYHEYLVDAEFKVRQMELERAAYIERLAREAGEAPVEHVNRVSSLLDRIRRFTQWRAPRVAARSTAEIAALAAPKRATVERPALS